jgi:hypothetical protein
MVAAHSTPHCIVHRMPLQIPNSRRSKLGLLGNLTRTCRGSSGPNRPWHRSGTPMRSDRSLRSPGRWKSVGFAPHSLRPNWLATASWADPLTRAERRVRGREASGDDGEGPG